MNPISQTIKKVAPHIQDVKPPDGSFTNTPQKVVSSLKAEIIETIPVKNPSSTALPNQTGATNNPIASNKPFVEASHEDKELDHILQDVNTSVKKADNSVEAKFDNLSGSRKKIAIKKAKIKEAHNGSPPIAATLVACIMALILSASAIMLYKK